MPDGVTRSSQGGSGSRGTDTTLPARARHELAGRALCDVEYRPDEEPGAIERPRGQLEDARRRGHASGDPSRYERAHRLDDAPHVVEKDDVDRVAHPDRV